MCQARVAHLSVIDIQPPEIRESFEMRQARVAHLSVV